MSRRRRSIPSTILRYWGVIPFVVLLSQFNNWLGIGGYFFFAGLMLVYLLFGAPIYCGAINRVRGADKTVEYCRNNSAGLMLGCNLRQDKWQKFHATFWTGQMRQRTRGMFDSPSAILQTAAAVVGLALPLVGLIRTMISHP